MTGTRLRIRGAKVEATTITAPTVKHYAGVEPHSYWPGFWVQKAIGLADEIELFSLGVTRPGPGNSVQISDRHIERLVLKRCNFQGGLRLRNVTINHLVLDSVSGIDSNGDLDDLLVDDSVIANRVHIATRADLRALARLRLRHVHFANGLSVLTSSEEVDLTGSSLGAASTISVAEAVAHAGQRPRLKSLSMASVNDLTLHGMDMSSCRLRGAQGLGSTRFVACVWPSSPGPVRRRIVYEEILWRRRWPARPNGLPRSRGLASQGQSPRVGIPPNRWESEAYRVDEAISRGITAWEVEAIYRDLGNGAKNQGLHPVSADFAWGEYTMRRLAGREVQRVHRDPMQHPPPSINRGPYQRRRGAADRALVRLYRAFGGYGLRARWPIVWALGVVAGLSYAMAERGFTKAGCERFQACGQAGEQLSMDAFLNSVSTTTAMVFSLSRPEAADVELWVPGALVAAKLACIILIGFAAFALRSRLRA